MSNRQQTAHAAAAGLRKFAAEVARTPVVLGFDGFVDSIIDVVDQRHDTEKFDAMKTIDQLGRKILAAAGQSSNYELVVTLEKLGGNGPIMANALATIGLKVDYIGCLGHPAIHHVFEPMTKIARCHTLCEPGYTDALEFGDGKLMFGKHSSLKHVNAGRLRQVLGDDKLRALMAPARLLGMVNWTMLTRMDGIWDYLMSEIFPKLPPLAFGGGARRIIFIDLADPEKRTRKDLAAALERCTRFQQFADTVLGYNLSEAVQVCQVLGIDPTDDPEKSIQKLCEQIRAKLGVHAVVVHPRKSAAAAGPSGSAWFAGPYVGKPKLSTGAGDNFNAGFATGLLAGLPLDQALCAGVAASGFYVRNAHSPTISQLADFCDHLPEPEAAQ